MHSSLTITLDGLPLGLTAGGRVRLKLVCAFPFMYAALDHVDQDVPDAAEAQP